jgi:N-acetylglucosaminyl-diphospho-decaprenol L-rhamnosyltransferase
MAATLPRKTPFGSRTAKGFDCLQKHELVTLSVGGFAKGDSGVELVKRTCAADGDGLAESHLWDGRAARPKVSAITVTYYTGPVLSACIDGLLAQPELGELIIVINGADRKTRAMLADRAGADGRIQLIDPGRNVGFAPGCNLGAAAAAYDYVAFVNPDCTLARNTFAPILDVFATQPNAQLVGGKLQHPDGREQRGGRREFLTPWRAFVETTRLGLLFPGHPYFRRFNMLAKSPMLGPTVVPVVSGAFMMMRRDYFARIGGMDENFFLHCDDLDLCPRVHRHRGEVWYAGNVPITHYRSTSDVPRLVVEWHKTRSSCYYFQKHFQPTYPWWALSALSAVLWARFFLIAARLLPSDLEKISDMRARESHEGWNGSAAEGSGTPQA